MNTEQQRLYENPYCFLLGTEETEKTRWELIDDVFVVWETLEREIEPFVAARKLATAKPQMERAIQLLLVSLALMNDTTIGEACRAPHVPNNVAERVQFIQLKITVFTSFIQLQQLFAEVKKMSAIQRVLQR